MAPLETAIKELRAVLGADATSPEWRWQVRGRLSEVKEALSRRQGRKWDGWLSARASGNDRDRHALQARVTALAAVVLDRMDTGTVSRELGRLVGDLEHYLQRVHDLVYDSVSIELGGSE